MGKGDKRTKRGKIIRGSYGKSRPRIRKGYRPAANASGGSKARTNRDNDSAEQS
ncbi:MAG: 30S ribosomal protein THX [Bacteroidia bacterium]|nr:30S ribosomal protein THX [Bacteroidia bacterium]